MSARESVSASMHWAYDVAVALFAKGYGEDTAQLVVNHIILAILSLAVLGSVYYVFVQFAGIGMKLLKSAVMTALALLFASLFIEMFTFTYPTPEAKAATKDAMHTIAAHTSSEVSGWWRKVFG